MRFAGAILFILALATSAFIATSPRLAYATGELVKGSGSAVYYVAADDTRYVFPNERIYFSWFSDFADVTTISDEALAGYPIGGSITYKPGTRLIKLVSVPTVYAVEAGGILRAIPSEAMARTLWGENWATLVDDLPDGFFTAYRVGEPLSDANPLYLEDVREDAAQLGLGTNQTEPIVGVVVESSPVVFADTEDQVIAEFVLSVPETTTIRDPIVVVDAATNRDNDEDAGGLIRGDGELQVEANIKNVRIQRADGVTLFSSGELELGDADASQSLRLSGVETLAPGRHRWRIVADIPLDAPEEESYYATLSIGDDFVITGSQVEVQEEALLISLGSGIEDAFAVRGDASQQDVVAFEFQNPFAESLTIETLSLTGFIDEGEGDADFLAGGDDDDGAATTLSSIVDLVSLVGADGTVLAQSATVGSDGSVHFENLDWVLSGGAVEEVTVRVHINPLAPLGEADDRLAFDIVDTEEDVHAVRLGIGEDVVGALVNGGENPNVFLTVAAHGELTIEGNRSGESLLVMGEDRAQAYAFTMTTGEAEDIVINTLTLRLNDVTAQESVERVILQYDSEGISYDAVANVIVGNVTWRNLEWRIPADEEVRAYAFVDVASSSQGAASGDAIAFAFEPATFEATGVVSGYFFDDEDFGDGLSDETQLSASSSVVRRNKPQITSASSLIDTSQDRAQDSEAFAFTITRSGEATTSVHALAFKIEPSDVGYELNDDPADNDLLEYLAEQSVDAIGNLVDEASNDVLGEGSNGHISFEIFSETQNDTVADPELYDTGRGDYAIVRYELASEIVVGATPRTFVWELDVSELAPEARTVKVTLLGGDDFHWSDGTVSGEDLLGDGVSQIPLAGPRISFD